MNEPIGGPDQPPNGMEFLCGRPAETHPQCQHGEHSITYISTELLYRICPYGTRDVYCKICGQWWQE